VAGSAPANRNRLRISTVLSFAGQTASGAKAAGARAKPAFGGLFRRDQPRGVEHQFDIPGVGLDALDSDLGATCWRQGPHRRGSPCEPFWACSRQKTPQLAPGGIAATDKARTSLLGAQAAPSIGRRPSTRRRRRPFEFIRGFFDSRAAGRRRAGSPTTIEARTHRIVAIERQCKRHHRCACNRAT